MDASSAPRYVAPTSSLAISDVVYPQFLDGDFHPFAFNLNRNHLHSTFTLGFRNRQFLRFRQVLRARTFQCCIAFSSASFSGTKAHISLHIIFNLALFRLCLPAMISTLTALDRLPVWSSPPLQRLFFPSAASCCASALARFSGQRRASGVPAAPAHRLLRLLFRHPFRLFRC